jgi:multicomponent Na+:H+ antiporter subunit E
MKGSILLFILLWLFWILLSNFNIQEIIVGGIVSGIIAVIVGYGFLRGPKTRYIKGFLFFLVYIPYYVYQEILANSKVVYSILTGRINPSIVEVRHSHSHDWGITVLSNSITMTPGTLTLEAKPSKLYVHWLNTKGDKNEIVRKFERILKNIWD